MTQLSPGTEIKEKDLTTTIARAATGRGATVGKFQWGPAYEIIQATDESDVVNSLGLPDDYTFASFYSTTNFLSYAGDCRIVRVVDEDTARNSSPLYNTANVTITTPGTGYQVGELVTLSLNDSVKQSDLITVTGTPTSTSITYKGVPITTAVQQVETITVAGTVGEVGITVAGQSTTVPQSSSLDVVADAVSTALNGNGFTATDDTVDTVTATYDTYGPKPKIANVAKNGLNIVSSINVIGKETIRAKETIIVDSGATTTGNLTVTFDASTGISPVSVGVIAGDSINVVASKISAVINGITDVNSSPNGKQVYIAFTDIAGFDSLSKTVVTYGGTGVSTHTATTQVGQKGVKQVEELVITGSPVTTIVYAGVSVEVDETDTASQVATKLANGLNGSVIFASASASGDEVTATRNDLGEQELPDTFSQDNATFTTAIDTPASIKTANEIATDIAGLTISGIDTLTPINNTVIAKYSTNGDKTPFDAVIENGVSVVSEKLIEATEDTVLTTEAKITSVSAGAVTGVYVPTKGIVEAISNGAELSDIVVTSFSGNTSLDFTITLNDSSDIYFPNDDLSDEAMSLTANINKLQSAGLPSVYGRFPGSYGDKITVDIITYADYIANEGNTLSIPKVPAGGVELVNLGLFSNNAPQNSNQYCVVVRYAGEILETWVVSTLDGDKDIYGNNIHISEFFKSGASAYIMASDDVWTNKSVSLQLGGGKDEGVTANEYMKGWDYFSDPENIYVNLMFAGGGAGEPLDESSIIQKYMINNVAEVRRDCVAFASPPQSLVVGLRATDAVDNVVSWRKGKDSNGVSLENNLNVNTSFAVLDGSYKYQQDKYSDKKRWIPLSGDIAGLCAYTDSVANPWDSPGGYNRGLIRNVIKLAYDPKRGFRDKLYEAQINPIVNSGGLGFVMLGDKTLQAKPSAFDRINVRRLFNLLERAISESAKYKLFQNNTEFTRRSFATEVTAYLDNIQSQGGVTSFFVQCDERNNPPIVIDRNEFVGSIFIAPPRSINFITLNFVATATGANFEELIGQAF